MKIYQSSKKCLNRRSKEHFKNILIKNFSLHFSNKHTNKILKVPSNKKETKQIVEFIHMLSYFYFGFVI